MRRLLSSLLALVSVFLFIIEPSVAALSQDQINTLKSGIYYFDVNGANCSGATSATIASSVASSSTLDLASISKKYGIGWAEVKQLNGSVVAEYNSADQLPEVASILKLIVADAFLSSHPNLDKTVTVTSGELYSGAGTGSNDPQNPKAGYKITLHDSLVQMLMNSSNTNANVIIDAAGGSKAITDKARQLGYKDTTIVGYYEHGAGGNASTVADLTNAMDNVYTASGEGYQIAQTALKNEKQKWGLDSEANKWAGVSNATGNTAVFNIANGSKYIITMYDDLNGEEGDSSPGGIPIQNATNAVVDSLRSGSAIPGPTDSSGGSETCSCSVDGQTGSVYKFVQTLAYHESGDNPVADNGGATGKYQYEPTTWANSAKSYYGPAAQYASAKDAPETVQDAVTYIEYSVKSVQFGGDLKKLAVSHIYPAVANDPSQWSSYRIGNNPTAQEYADQFMDQYNNGKGQDDPLKFIAAPDFTSWYSKSVGRPYDSATSNDSSSGAVSSCNSGSPAASFVFYNQYDSQWASHAYGSSTIADSGCGPTSVAMVVATLSDSSVTPTQTADFGTSNGAYIPNQGSDHQKMLIDGPKHWGLSSTPLGTDLSRAASIIQQGGLVIAAGTGGSPFSKEGHIIVLRAVTSDGKFLIGNPAPNLQNSQDQAFSAEDLTSAGLQALYGVTK